MDEKLGLNSAGDVPCVIGGYGTVSRDVDSFEPENGNEHLSRSGSVIQKVYLAMFSEPYHVTHLDEPPFSNANGNRNQLLLSLVAENESELLTEMRLPRYRGRKSGLSLLNISRLTYFYFYIKRY